MKGTSFVILSMPLAATVYVNEVSSGKPSACRLVARETKHLLQSWNFQQILGLCKEKRGWRLSQVTNANDILIDQAKGQKEASIKILEFGELLSW